MTPNQPVRLPVTPPMPGARTPNLPQGAGPVVGQPVSQVDFFRHMPTGGATVYLRPSEVAQND
ncbi:hypothetical protein [Lentzea californiensis]|uniref:hypothetical protein n=1 Tax=Lentzea californiensis TaxID=438851 RepID=UPI0021656B8D|nr:hypothetical protein [Lentzea californiensis]MCR3749520.1 hypothetical protein [Lentzea californiensis]